MATDSTASELLERIRHVISKWRAGDLTIEQCQAGLVKLGYSTDTALDMMAADLKSNGR